jgi:histidinol phosphatase-like enzyme
MIEKAAMDFNVDLKASWLIGDTTTDLQTGKNTGMRTILLRTGKGGKDGKFDCAADFTFDHLEGAVDFILENSRQCDRHSADILECLKAEKARSSSEVK